MDITLSQAVHLEEVVQEAADCVGSLPGVRCLIYEVCYLPGESLTAHSKKSTLSWGQEVNGAWLEGVGGVVDLLSHVEGVVHCTLQRTWLRRREGWRRRELISYSELQSDLLLRVIAHGLVVRSLLRCQHDMLFSGLDDLELCDNLHVVSYTSH